mmetsp:Transcript_35671/g.47046  ORF Transcript_35671/g.47046 Transcript_35671/m.47046 type:complete len:273 (+) Transcript_35671:151-969(+)
MSFLSTFEDYEDDMKIYTSVMKQCREEEEDDDIDLDFLAEEIEADMECKSEKAPKVIIRCSKAIKPSDEAATSEAAQLSYFSALSDEMLERVFVFSFSKAVSQQWRRCSENVQRDRWRSTFAAAWHFQPGLVNEIEHALYESCDFQVNGQYKQAARRLVFNLKQTAEAGSKNKNKVLRARVSEGLLSPQQLVRMDPEDLAPQELQEQRKEWSRKRTQEVTRDAFSVATETDAFQCDNCGGVKCKYVRWRRKRQVDRTRMMVTCIACNHAWEH